MAAMLIVIAGATASGKTALAIALARKLNGEIISADSRMVYRGLDIGSGKPTWEYRQTFHSPWLKPTRQTNWGPVYEIEGVPHHMLDVVTPKTRFTLTDWLSGAQAAMADIRARGKQPVVTGGTGLYLKALLQGYRPPPTDPQVRSEIEKLTTEAIIQELAKHDPTILLREGQNRRRLIRALEVWRLTGRPFSSFTTTLLSRSNKDVDAVIFAIAWPREELYRRIDTRLRDRLANGMIDEVKSLLTQGHDPAAPVEWLRSIGLEYRIITNWLLDHPHHLHSNTLLVSEKEMQELEERLRGAIHAYARRQLTYLRHQLPVRWLTPEQVTQLTEHEGKKFKSFLQRLIANDSRGDGRES